MTSSNETTGKTNQQNEDGPAIYIACLAAYNAGFLHGRWIRCDEGAEAIRAQVAEILAASPVPGAEEWAIHDFQGFGSLRIDEYEDLDTVAELAELIGEHGVLAGEVVSHVGGLKYLDDAKEALESQYQGAWDSLADWAEDLVESTDELEKVPEQLRHYIDFERYADDLELEHGGRAVQQHQPQLRWGRFGETSSRSSSPARSTSSGAGRLRREASPCPLRYPCTLAGPPDPLHHHQLNRSISTLTSSAPQRTAFIPAKVTRTQRRWAQSRFFCISHSSPFPAQQGRQQVDPASSV